MAKTGLRVAKEGKDASRGTGRDLVFTSEAQSLKISDEFRDTVREIQVPGSGFTNLTVNITHTLGYAPVVRLFVELPVGSGHWYNDAYTPDEWTESAAASYYYYIKDINSERIQLRFGVQGGTLLRFKYWLFEDGLELI